MKIEGKSTEFWKEVFERSRDYLAGSRMLITDLEEKLTKVAPLFQQSHESLGDLGKDCLKDIYLLSKHFYETAVHSNYAKNDHYSIDDTIERVKQYESHIKALAQNEQEQQETLVNEETQSKGHRR